ncbi:hypothetical protein [Pyrofollis japonicus]|uniref:hypothetical protein n=1 Tax=Pyrofollis japonicus TaxID=3060460 RepID=UPI00295AD0B6|nr:hypothetical protein [Pyrofollis japonicus]
MGETLARQEILGNVDFFYVVNYTLVLIGNARARVRTRGLLPDIADSVDHYKQTIEHLSDLVAPLFPGEEMSSVEELLREAEDLLNKNRPVEALRRYRQALRVMLRVLYENGLLLPQRRIRVGSIAGPSRPNQ